MALVKDVKEFSHAFKVKWSKACNSSTWTHFLTSTNTKHQLLNDKLYPFWRNYCHLVDVAEDEPMVVLDVAERVKQMGPVVLKIELPFQTELAEDEMEGVHRFIIAVIATYQECIAMKYDIQFRHSLKAVILAGDKPGHLDTYYTYCYRIHFPHIQVDFQHHVHQLRSAVLNECREQTYMNLLPSNIMKDLNELITVPTTVPLYGSTEQRHAPVMQYLYICGYLNDLELDFSDMSQPVADMIAEVMMNIDDDNCFDITKHEHYSKALEDRGEDFSNLFHWLPLYLSQGYSGIILTRREDIDSGTPLNYNPIVGGVSASMTEEQDLLSTFMVMLSTRRFQDESSWMDIGRALHFVYKGGIRGLQFWVDYTERHVPSRAPRCEQLYDTIKDRNPMITHRTVAWYVMKDSPIDYDTWHQRWLMQAMETLFKCKLKPTHYDVGVLIYRMFWLECAVTRSGKWYEFHNHGWIDNGTNSLGIQTRVMKCLLEYLRNLQLSADHQRASATTEDDRDKFDIQISSISMIVTKIKDDGYLNRCLNVSRTLFLIEGIQNEFDRNKLLFRVQNGMIEIIPKKCAIFRDGKPEDYVTKMAGVPYRTTFTYDSRQVQEFMKWIRQMHHYPSVVRFFLKLNATYLQGGNQYRFLLIYYGEQGGNGKSTILACGKQAFGDYHCEVPLEVFMSRKSGSGPNPELARIEGARVISGQETEADEKMKSSIIKKLTGNDAFYARKNHQDGGDILPQHKIIIACNQIPEITNADKATRTRLLCIPFDSVWVTDAPQSEEEQQKTRRYPLDVDFDFNKMNDMAEAFLWVMVQYFKIYCEEGIMDNIPKEIIDTTNAYWLEKDILQHFIDDRLLEVKGVASNNHYILNKNLWAEYTNWMGELHPGLTKKDSDAFYKEMTKKLGKPKDNKYYGWRLVEFGVND